MRRRGSQSSGSLVPALVAVIAAYALVESCPRAGAAEATRASWGRRQAAREAGGSYSSPRGALHLWSRETWGDAEPPAVRAARLADEAWSRSRPAPPTPEKALPAPARAVATYTAPAGHPASAVAHPAAPVAGAVSYDYGYGLSNAPVAAWSAPAAATVGSYYAPAAVAGGWSYGAGPGTYCVGGACYTSSPGLLGRLLGR